MYLQMYQVLRSRLEQGMWRPGETLPAEPALMDEFRASRVTVRAAMSLLERDGLVRRRRGVGTTVEAVPRSERWVHIPTTMDELLEMQRAVQPRVLNVGEDGGLPDVQLPPDGSPARQYVRMQRVHLHEGRAYCVNDLAIEAALFKRHEKGFLERPALLVMYEDEGVKIASARQDLSIRSAELAEARHLGLDPGSPVAEVRRVMADETGVVVYAAVLVYVPHMVQLSMDLLASHPAVRAKEKP